VELPLVFHITRGADGSLTTTMDSPAQGAMGIPTSATRLEGDRLVIEVAAISGRFEGGFSEDGSAIEGVWSQGPNELPLTLTRGEPEKPARPQEPRPPFPYRVEDVRFANDFAGIELAGTLTLPEGEGPFPAVVLISGSGPQDRDETLLGHKPFLVIADHFTRRGIAVLRFDDRGVGESEGSFATATSADFATDAHAAVQYLARRPEIAADRIGLVGHSEGGLIAPMVAAHHDDVAFVVLMAGPGVPGSEILTEQGARILTANGVSQELVESNRARQERLFRVVREAPAEELAARIESELRAEIEGMGPEERAVAGVTEDQLETVIRQQVQQLSSPWFRYFLTYDPREALRRVTVPVLVVNGSLDLQVPADQNVPEIEAALREAGNHDVTVRVFEGLNHLFQPATTGSPNEYATIETTFSPEVLDVMAGWILERFGGR